LTPILIAALALLSQENPVGPLDRAYSASKANDLDDARVHFSEAIKSNPNHLDARLDYAYLLLRLGDSLAAREQFAFVLSRRPNDESLILEYAYLAYETGAKAKALEAFTRLKLTARNEPIRLQAAATADRITATLDSEIQRWRQNAKTNPNSYSVHEELARLEEERNDFVSAASSYRAAFGLKPDRRRYLLDIARVENEAIRPDYSFAALLAASRGTDPFVAEAARELLPSRYPYVYEFELAISLDPLNVPLRRELGFLHLKMQNEPNARQVFEDILRIAPDDTLSLTQLGFLKMASKQENEAKPLLARAARQSESGLSAVRDLAQRSFEKGFLKDALQYLEQIQEASPADHATMLRLGWTHNLLKNDAEAIRWFGLARSSPDPKIANEAKRAYDNLRPSLAPFRTTTWTLPFYSSRWREVFAYGQAKVEFRTPLPFLKPYLSSRWIGDLGRAPATATIAPQALSERAMVVAAGLATRPWRGLLVWGEAGASYQYFARQQNTARIAPDYRAGLNYARSVGNAALGSEGGAFYSTTADAVFLSRFGNNTLFYSQNRIGYTLPERPIQFYLNFNLTADARRMDWANYAEFGPGVRFRPPGLPPGFYLFADVVRGLHTVYTDTSRPRRYTDFRAGVWYAFTH
jgi:Tfp pilus assembly protein PilF